MAHIPFYTCEQLKIFAEDLLHTFVNTGFNVLEEPYIDYDLCGFRATYIRRYLLHKPTPSYDGILTTLVHVIARPFGSRNQKMVIKAEPRNINNELVSDTVKLRIHFDPTTQTYQVIHGDHQAETTIKTNVTQSNSKSTTKLESYQQQSTSSSAPPSSSFWIQQAGFKKMDCDLELSKELQKYVSHILEAISPGLIELPFELKLEILKKLSVESIIKMSQVNSEFRALIFVHGESLWRHLCQRDFNITTINRFVHKSWMELYRDSYLLNEIEICRKERALPGLPERPALPPAPGMLQIEWLPDALQLPFLPINEPVIDDRLNIALGWAPIRRSHSLDSLH